MIAALASTVDIDTLRAATDNSGVTSFLFVLFMVLYATGLISISVAVIDHRRNNRSRAALAVIGLVSVGLAAASFAQAKAIRPDVDAEITSAFVTAYPGLSLHAEDLECITAVAVHSDKTCSATRKVTGGYAKVEYTNYRGKLVITAPGGTTVTNDTDIRAQRSPSRS